MTDGGDGILYGNGGFQDNSLTLDGESGFVLFDGQSSLSPTGSVTFCLWVNPAADDRLMRLFGRFQAANGARDYCVFLASGNRVGCFFSDDGSAGEGHAILKTTVEPILPPAQWRHLTVTWDAANPTVADSGQGHGPKKSICAGLSAARRGGTVSVAEGVYVERVVENGVRLVLPGKVVIREPR